MKELEKLLQQQAEALKFGNFVALNEINKKIFELRQQHRKQKTREKELELDTKIDEKIVEILTK